MFKANLVYRVSSRTASATQRNPFLKNKGGRNEDFCLKSPQSSLESPEAGKPTKALTQQQPRQGYLGNPKANGRELDLNRGPTTLDNENMYFSTDIQHCVMHGKSGGLEQKHSL